MLLLSGQDLINSYTNAAQIIQAGGEPLILEIARSESALQERSAERWRNADLIVTSGGVSVGDLTW